MKKACKQHFKDQKRTNYFEHACYLQNKCINILSIFLPAIFSINSQTFFQQLATGKQRTAHTGRPDKTQQPLYSLRPSVEPGRSNLHLPRLRHRPHLRPLPRLLQEQRARQLQLPHALDVGRRVLRLRRSGGVEEGRPLLAAFPRLPGTKGRLQIDTGKVQKRPNV